MMAALRVGGAVLIGLLGVLMLAGAVAVHRRHGGRRAVLFYAAAAMLWAGGVLVALPALLA